MSVLTYPRMTVPELLLSTPDGQVLANRKLDPVRAYWIGRESVCDIVVESQSVSRRHALVFHSYGRWYICDSGSTGGLETESGAVRCTTLSADSWVKIGSIYLWLAGGPSFQPDFVDAQAPLPEEGRRPRKALLAIEDTAAPSTSMVSDVLTVTDHRGVVHLCADLSGLAATPGSGVPRLTIGRSSAADLRIIDPSIDPIHAVLALGTERWSLIDVGSSCGILFEGKRWFRKRMEDGITLPIGNFRISMQPVIRTTAPDAATSLPSPLQGDAADSKFGLRRPSAFLDDGSNEDSVRLS